VIAWKQVPWSLWGYVVIMLIGTILVEVQAHGGLAPQLIYPLVMVVWAALLLKGTRWVWIATVAISIVGFIVEIVLGSLAWQGIALGLIGPVFLVLPDTQRFFSNANTAIGTSP